MLTTLRFGGSTSRGHMTAMTALAARLSYGTAASKNDNERYNISHSNVLHRNMSKDPLLVESARGCYLSLKGGMSDNIFQICPFDLAVRRLLGIFCFTRQEDLRCCWWSCLDGCWTRSSSTCQGSPGASGPIAILPLFCVYFRGKSAESSFV